jgi:hypothetical protein
MKAQAREVFNANGIALQHVWSVSAIFIDQVTVFLASSSHIVYMSPVASKAPFEQYRRNCSLSTASACLLNDCGVVAVYLLDISTYDKPYAEGLAADYGADSPPPLCQEYSDGEWLSSSRLPFHVAPL